MPSGSNPARGGAGSEAGGAPARARSGARGLRRLLPFSRPGAGQRPGDWRLGAGGGALGRRAAGAQLDARSGLLPEGLSGERAGLHLRLGRFHRRVPGGSGCPDHRWRGRRSSWWTRPHPRTKAAWWRRSSVAHSNIRYMRTPERIGIYPAWNLAVRVACGEFVTSASTNDRLSPEAYGAMSTALRERPEVALVYGDSHLTDLPHERFGGPYPQPLPRRGLPLAALPLRGSLANCLCGPHPHVAAEDPPGGRLLRRKIPGHRRSGLLESARLEATAAAPAGIHRDWPGSRPSRSPAGPAPWPRPARSRPSAAAPPAGRRRPAGSAEAGDRLVRPMWARGPARLSSTHKLHRRRYLGQWI